MKSRKVAQKTLENNIGIPSELDVTGTKGNHEGREKFSLYPNRLKRACFVSELGSTKYFKRRVNFLLLYPIQTPTVELFAFFRSEERSGAISSYLCGFMQAIVN